MPILFLEYPDDDTLGKLTLEYDYIYEKLVNGPDGVEREDTLTYFVSQNSMIPVLRMQSYYGYPLAVDVESWEVNETVNLGSYSAVVIGATFTYGHDCWECEIGNQTYVEYDMDVGLLIRYHWVTLEEERLAVLVDMNLELPDPYVNDAGVLLAGIFVELAVIIWLFSQRLEKSR